MNNKENIEAFSKSSKVQNSPIHRPPQLQYFGTQRNQQKQDESPENSDLENSIEGMADPPNPPERIMQNNAQTVSLKDALRCVPEFSGKPGTFYTFQEGCEEAKEMIGDAAEGNLVKVIRSKVTGDARRTLKGTSFTTVAELISYLKSVYFSNEPLFQLYGNMAKLHQKPDELVIIFVNRIREMNFQIIDAFKSEQNPNEATLRDFKTNLERNSIAVFKKGLKPDIEQRLTDSVVFNDVVQSAIKAEKYLKDKEDLHLEAIIKKHNQTDRRHTFACQLCEDDDHEAPCCPKLAESMIFTICQLCAEKGHDAKNCSKLKEVPKKKKNEDITCQYCEKKGHEAKNCFQIKKLSKSDKGPNEVCDKCQLKGHKNEDCRVNINKFCTHCKIKGHQIEECRLKKRGITRIPKN